MEVFNNKILEDGLNKFKTLTKKPEYFLGVQEKVGEDVRQLLKNIYDYTKRSEELTSYSTNGVALPELVIKHFDEEQIWQELELQNGDKCNRFISDVSQLVARRDNLNFGVSDAKEKKSTDKVKLDYSKDSVGSDDEHSLNGIQPDVGHERHEAEEEEKELSTHEPKVKGRSKSKPSIVDDKFFKLKDLENYLNKEDKKENKKNKKPASSHKDDVDDDDDEESIDYFQDSLSDEDEDDDGGNSDVYYQDFFDPPDPGNDTHEIEKKEVASGSEEEEKSGSGDDDDGNDDGEEEDGEESDGFKSENKHDGKQVRFNMSPASSGSDSSESDDKEDQKEEKGVKSSFEARQERIKARIGQLEEEALAEKSWQLKGTASAADRPQNSLLEEILEFDLSTRPAPVVTEQTTVKLEDIIRQRIKDKVWDDVERKVKPVKAPDEYKKQLVMDQEKSKLSLAEVYEQEYIKQREAQDPSQQEKPEEEPKEHQEVRAMMSSLFAKLDALSNFHYTPKPVAPEIKVISNLPAISMEEVAPVAISDATLLAPEEVKAKPKGDIIGKAERTKTDKKRERRHKKAIQRQRYKERENRVKTVEKLKPGLGNKYSKERALQMLEKVTKDKNVEEMVDMGKDKGVRSSKAFFARLQEEVTSHIKAQTESGKRKKMNNNISAKKLKF